MTQLNATLRWPLLGLLLSALCPLPCPAAGPSYPPPPPAATQAAVNAGTATGSYVSPATLAGKSGGGNGSGLTNIQGTAFSQGTTTVSGTNLNLLIGTIYQTATLTNNCNVTNVSGLGTVTIKFLPGGANRTLSFPTNWVWLNTNGLALVGPLYSITLTNGASRGGFFSAWNSGSDPTNTSAAYQQTP